MTDINEAMKRQPTPLMIAIETTQMRLSEYLRDYKMATDDGADYRPTEFEAALIEDAIQGLLADSEFMGALVGWLRLKQGTTP